MVEYRWSKPLVLLQTNLADAFCHSTTNVGLLTLNATQRQVLTDAWTIYTTKPCPQPAIRIILMGKEIRCTIDLYCKFGFMTTIKQSFLRQTQDHVYVSPRSLEETLQALIGVCI